MQKFLNSKKKWHVKIAKTAITIGYSIDNIVQICTRICFIRAIVLIILLSTDCTVLHR